MRRIERPARFHPSLVQLRGGPLGADAQLARRLGPCLRRHMVCGPAFLQTAQLPEAQAQEEGSDEEEGEERKPAGEG